METVSEGEGGGIGNLKIGGGGYWIRYQIPGHDMSGRIPNLQWDLRLLGCFFGGSIDDVDEDEGDGTVLSYRIWG